MTNKMKALGLTAAILFAIAFFTFLCVISKGVAFVAGIVGLACYCIYRIILEHLDNREG